MIQYEHPDVAPLAKLLEDTAEQQEETPRAGHRYKAVGVGNLAVSARLSDGFQEIGVYETEPDAPHRIVRGGMQLLITGRPYDKKDGEVNEQVHFSCIADDGTGYHVGGVVDTEPGYSTVILTSLTIHQTPGKPSPVVDQVYSQVWDIPSERQHLLADAAARITGMMATLDAHLSSSEA